MSDLRELYQEMILDHGKSPRNFHALSDADGQAEGHNPLCGDRITLFIRREGDVLKELGFEGTGCAISQAAASLLTEVLKGKSKDEVEKIKTAYLDMLTGEPGRIPDIELLDKLTVFSGVCEFPMRVKCATLAWHTLEAALAGGDEPVTTE